MVCGQQNNTARFGAIAGRVVNRIANATFTLDGTRYQVHEARLRRWQLSSPCEAFCWSGPAATAAIAATLAGKANLHWPPLLTTQQASTAVLCAADTQRVWQCAAWRRPGTLLEPARVHCPEQHRHLRGAQLCEPRGRPGAQTARTVGEPPAHALHRLACCLRTLSERRVM